MLLFTLFSLPLLCCRVSAAPSSIWKYAVKETHPVPTQWTHVSDAPANYVVKVDIALKQGQFDQLERQLYEGKINRNLVIS